MPELSYKRKGGIALEYCNGQTEKLAIATRRIRHLSQFFFQESVSANAQKIVVNVS
jgi:hypothetical protein